jgi:hypothetical protein
MCQNDPIDVNFQLQKSLERGSLLGNEGIHLVGD